jgi:hypothetical protein
MRALAALAVAAGAFAWWRYADAERRCAAAERDTRGLLERGAAADALRHIDEVDARCRCARFTRGDAPPHYSLAAAALRHLEERGEHAQAQRILSGARGPLLRELARDAAR